jgi:hypothetical protein
MPRGVYLLGVGLALLALALAFTKWALSLRPGVTEANARKIRKGMTAKQVEDILGPPTTCTRVTTKTGREIVAPAKAVVGDQKEQPRLRGARTSTGCPSRHLASMILQTAPYCLLSFSHFA